jgi:plasmid maintenance system antidote protein VapI
MLSRQTSLGNEMSISIELLDAFKSANGGCSDYRAAKLIGVSQQTISKIRQTDTRFSPEKVLLLCEMAGLDSVEWLLRWHRERARCDKEKAVFDTVLTRMAA